MIFPATLLQTTRTETDNVEVVITLLPGFLMAFGFTYLTCVLQDLTFSRMSWKKWSILGIVQMFIFITCIVMKFYIFAVGIPLGVITGIWQFYKVYGLNIPVTDSQNCSDCAYV